MKRYLLVFGLLLVSVIGFGRVYSSWMELPDRERRMFVEARNFMVYYLGKCGISVGNYLAVLDGVHICVGRDYVGDRNFDMAVSGSVYDDRDGDTWNTVVLSVNRWSSVRLLVHEMCHIYYIVERYWCGRDYMGMRRDIVDGLCRGIRIRDSYKDDVEEIFCRVMEWRYWRYVNGIDVLLCSGCIEDGMDRINFSSLFDRYDKDILRKLLSLYII